jgi:hypothetical protein
MARTRRSSGVSAQLINLAARVVTHAERRRKRIPGELRTHEHVGLARLSLGFGQPQLPKPDAMPNCDRAG